MHSVSVQFCYICIVEIMITNSPLAICSFVKGSIRKLIQFYLEVKDINTKDNKTLYLSNMLSVGILFWFFDCFHISVKKQNPYISVYYISFNLWNQIHKNIVFN